MIRQFLATILICGSTLSLPAAETTEQIAQLFAAAESGNAAAQYELARRYDNGTGVVKDEAEAVKWYTKAAEQGLAAAQCTLGVCYENGEGVPVDMAKAVQLYTLAAKQNYAQAQCYLGMCYEDGTGVKRDYKKAAELYASAARNNHLESKFNLGRCYYMGLGVERDLNKAASLTQEAADAGYAEAKTMLAFFYVIGTDVTPRNFDKAGQLLNEAKAAGETEVSGLFSLFLGNKDDEETNRAKKKLGTAIVEASKHYGAVIEDEVALGLVALNMFGFNIDVDSGVSQKEVIQLLKKSSDNHNPQAQFMYAMYLFDTEGNDSKDGIKYLTLASEKNYDLAQYALMFRNREMGIQADSTETLQEMKKKANEGDAICQFLLGGWYYSLSPEDEERDQCIEWWKKALENHFGPAAYQLGLYYCELERYEESVKYLLQASEIAIPNTQSTIFHILHQLHSDKHIKIDKKKMEELRQRLQKHGRNFDNDYSGFFSQLKMVVSTLYKVAMYIMNNISGLS